MEGLRGHQDPIGRDGVRRPVDSVGNHDRVAAKTAREARPMLEMSGRDLEILRLLGEGRSLTEIAAALGIAYKTVANTCTRLKGKLGVARIADLVRVAIEMRLV